MSLQKSITTPKVQPAYAMNVLSDRLQNHASALCIPPNYQDGYGRVVHPYSFKSLTSPGGCWDPMLRIDVENAVVRPSYHQYLDIDGLRMDGPSYSSSMKGYDTLLGERVPNRVRYFERNASQQIPVPQYGSPDEFLQQQRALNLALRRYYEVNQFKNSGMF